MRINNTGFTKWVRPIMWGTLVATTLSLNAYMAIGKYNNKRLNSIEERAAQSCSEIYGRLLTNSPELIDACRIGVKTTVNQAKQTFHTF